MSGSINCHFCENPMPDNQVVKSIHAGTGQEGYCVACMVCGASGPVTISISDAVNEYHKINMEANND